MKFKSSIILPALAIIISIGSFWFQRPKKVAYIRSSELVYGYLGMEDAHRDFEEKSKTWKANIDTLQRDYKIALSNYTSSQKSLNKSEKEEQERILMQQQQDIINYSQSIQAKAKEEDDKVTEGVLNQVNSFISEYGKEHGYDVILGTTLSGSLLYGDEGLDITKEVLDALNKNYKGK